MAETFLLYSFMASEMKIRDICCCLLKIYIKYMIPHLVAQALRNVGRVKCIAWNMRLQMIFKGSGCFQFPEAVVTSTAKKP